MRAQEFIIENADQAAVDALQKKHGWSTGRTSNGDLYFTWQGRTYVFYGERMRITLSNDYDNSVSVVWGMKPNWQGRGNNELSFAQAVQQKLLKFDLSIWQQLDRGQINDNQAIQKFKQENERQAREAIAQGVTEGKLNEYRDQLWTWVQSKFPKTQWPEYVQRDFLYAKAKGNKNQKDLEDFLNEIQQDFGQVRWQLEKLPITLDIFTPKTQRMIQSREGGSSNPYQVPKDAERHALQQKIIQQKGVSQEPIIVAKLSNGYDLIEGWHRTIQHLKEFPQGYTAPAWVGYGATYTSESVEQGVTEGQEKFNQEIMKPGFEFRQEINGVTYEVTNNQGFGPVVTVTDKNNEVIAQAGFWKHKTRPGLESLSTHVEPEWQGQGIAANMYAVMRMLGANISPSTNQTDDGRAMWDKWEKQGDAGHIKNLNPRIKEQTVTEGQLSVDVPNEEWLQDKIDYAKRKGRNSYGVPYMGSTTASVRGTPPRVRVMRLASLPGMRNEQTNVRRDDLKWLMDYMEKTGKLPPMGNNPNEEYLPYIMVAYNGEAWVNEGNHRIMAAYRLNWQDMPVEIRYFDGGERIATGPMAPGKIGLA